MQPVAAVAGILLYVLILWEGFETVLLPRRVTRKVRLTRLFYTGTWMVWSGVFGRIANRKRRDQALSAFGPLSMVVLLVLWAVSLMFSFALIHWGRQSPLHDGRGAPGDFLTYFYVSGTNFLTLGLGDIVPRDALSRLLTVAEAGTGFGFLAIVIGYLPVLYGAFSQREVRIVLLDARAGTPSSAVELLRRHARGHSLGALDQLFADWEQWSADLLESHLSYPVLSYYRSQHDNQSWLGSLTTILDTCSLILAGAEGPSRWQAQLTFAIARHAAVDLAQIHNTPPQSIDRLSDKEFASVCRTLEAAGIKLAAPDQFRERLRELRTLYEPYVSALAQYLLVTLPEWQRRGNPPDNWQTSAWERRAAGLARRGIFDVVDDHDM